MKFNFGEAGNINLMQLHTFKVWWLNVTPLIHSKETTVCARKPLFVHIPYVHNLDATIHKEFEHRMAGNRAHSSCHYTKFFCISQTPSCVWISSCEHTHHFRNFLLKYYGRVLICATNSTVQTLRAGSLFSTSGVLFTSSEGATLQFRCSHSRLHCSCARHQN